MKFDEILIEVGEFGPYQRRVYFLVCLACITSAFQTLLPVFILDMPEYRCKIVSMPNDTYKIQSPYHASLVNQSIPMETTEELESYASCRLYDVTNSSKTSHGSNKSQTTCHRWVYDQSTFTSTVITQFDMVCDHASFRSHLNMVGFGGMLTGAVVFGIITDIVGRKITLLASGVIQLIFGIALAFPPNFIVFAVFRFFTGIAAMSTFMIAFVIGLELVGPSKRTVAGIAIQFFWCFGLFVLALVAYFIREWKYLQIVMTIPSVFFIAYWWVIPESPRWLLSRGRVDEAEVILNKLARVNGRSLPKDFMERLMLEKGPEMKIWHMFTSPVLIFDMVCDHASFRSHLNMVGFGGMLTGAVVFGIITDIVGRKITLLASGVIQLIFGIALAFPPNFIVFAVFRFFTGIAAMSTFMIAFVIGLELVGPSKRTVAGIAIQFFWCFGLFVLALVAYFIREWKYLQIVMTIPSVFFIAYWWVIPESPRWLLSRGRVDEAEVILNKLARVNGRSLPKDFMERLMLEKGPEMKIWHMFTSPVLIVRAIVLFCQWLAINIIYYGLSLNVSNLSGDVFLNFTISSAVETASYVMCIVLLERTGRKKLYCASMLLGGAACIATLFPVIYGDKCEYVLGGAACIATLFPVIYGDKSHTWITVTLAMIGKFGASAAFAVLYVFSGEIFPTVVRQSGIGACSVFEGIGGMVAPYISDLGIIFGGDLAEALPLTVFGVITVSAGLLSLLLPETKNKKLPETIEDAILFGRKQESDTYAYDPIAP